MSQDILSLYELNNLVRRQLEKTLADEYWIEAELSDVHARTSGHCYLEFIQKSPHGEQLLAKARGMIWSNVYSMLKPYFEQATGQLFTAGIKVRVLVTVQFHEVYGYSLTVCDIDPAYTLGDMALRRREILEQLMKDGVLNLNKELAFPDLPQRVAVISSPTAAGYEDFVDQLKRNPLGFYFYTELFPTIMQGHQTEASLLNSLEEIQNRLDEFDVVVIIRGGGSTSDLSGFDTYLLGAACAQFPLPIVTGIGHERDDTVIDSVSHTRVKTPTAAAELLIGYMDTAAERLNSLAELLRQKSITLLETEHNRLKNIQLRIPVLVAGKMNQARLNLQLLQKDLKQGIQNLLKEQRHKLQLVKQHIDYASPERILARGYSITLKDGKAVKDAASLKSGDKVITRLHKGSIELIVNEK